LHNIQRTAAEDVALLLGVCLEQAEDQIVLLEPAITRHFKFPRQFLKLGEGFALKSNNIHCTTPFS